MCAAEQEGLKIKLGEGRMFLEASTQPVSIL
jgi:hypothetical protein